MPPIDSDTADGLRESVRKLEARIKELESKIEHFGTGTPHSPPEGVRMILMGPPGAGEF